MPQLKNTNTPTLKPPNAKVGGASSGSSRPKDLTVAQAASTAVQRVPTLSPPQAAARSTGGAADAVAGSWSTVAVDATWSTNEPRNAFFHVAGGGWKKVFNGSDGSFTALVTLASQAKQTGRPVYIREEDDAMVHEIYLW